MPLEGVVQSSWGCSLQPGLKFPLSCSLAAGPRGFPPGENGVTSAPAGGAVVPVPCRPPEDQEENSSSEERRGLQVRGADGACLSQGLFVQLVQVNTPASLVGLRFGDQILQIDGRDCAGWSTDKAHRAVKKASAEKIVMVVRDRPFQRTVTMHKDSTGHVGFVIKKGKVASVVKGSSAARNGLLTNHYVCEVNGQNVIGLKDKEIIEILAMAGNVITLTIIPTVIYEHMVKKLSPTLLQHTMDHSIPDV